MWSWESAQHPVIHRHDGAGRAPGDYDLAGLSQVELVFDAAFDPPFYQFHGMHDVMFLPSDHAKTYPRLPQLPPRMQRFGIVGSSTATRSASGDPDSPRPWTLAFTWPVKRPAWTTFMATQDQLQPQRFALLPPLLIPLTYLTRLADLVDATFDTTMVRWLPHANGSQRRLVALISGLFSVWTRRPSQAAVRSRSLVPQAATSRIPALTRSGARTRGAHPPHATTTFLSDGHGIGSRWVQVVVYTRNGRS